MVIIIIIIVVIKIIGQYSEYDAVAMVKVTKIINHKTPETEIWNQNSLNFMSWKSWNRNVFSLFHYYMDICVIAFSV